MELDEEFELLSQKIDGMVANHSTFDIDRINDNLVKEALKKMKVGKTDALFLFSSDCLINGPESLLPHLTNLIKLFVSHGKAPFFLLVCSLVPIVKDNLGDIATSDNYKAIAIAILVELWPRFWSSVLI